MENAIDSCLQDITKEFKKLKQENNELKEENRKIKSINTALYEIINLQEEIIKREVHFPTFKPPSPYQTYPNCCTSR